VTVRGRLPPFGPSPKSPICVHPVPSAVKMLGPSPLTNFVHRLAFVWGHILALPPEPVSALAERGSVTRSALPDEPRLETASTSPCHRRAAARRAALRGQCQEAPHLWASRQKPNSNRQPSAVKCLGPNAVHPVILSPPLSPFSPVKYARPLSTSALSALSAVKPSGCAPAP
jgi:hypothetical protein